MSGVRSTKCEAAQKTDPFPYTVAVPLDQSALFVKVEQIFQNLLCRNPLMVAPAVTRMALDGVEIRTCRFALYSFWANCVVGLLLGSFGENKHIIWA